MAMVDVPGCDIPIRISHKDLLYSDIMSYNKPPLCIEVRILQYIPQFGIRDSLKIIYDADNVNTIISLSSVPKFDKGQLVRIIEGPFQGVVGKVARYQGQQRVAVIVDGLVTVVTAYVPSAFLEKMQK